MLNAHHIRWVLLRNNLLRWERDYNAWLEPAYGLKTQHYIRLPQSPAFEEVYSGPIYRLFFLKPSHDDLDFSSLLTPQ